jgi:hypothetical protein
MKRFYIGLGFILLIALQARGDEAQSPVVIDLHDDAELMTSADLMPIPLNKIVGSTTSDKPILQKLDLSVVTGQPLTLEQNRTVYYNGRIGQFGVGFEQHDPDGKNSSGVFIRAVIHLNGGAQ